jgi:hypothetical protein
VRLVTGGRQTGKTTVLIRRSHETGYPIICCDYARAVYVKHMAGSMGLSIPQPQWYSQAVIGSGVRGIGKVLVDDVDALLGFIFRTDIDYATLCTDYCEIVDINTVCDKENRNESSPIER